MAKGYVYVLSNRSMPQALKIGSTTRDPFTRAKELQSTGVPDPFHVMAAVFVTNVKASEAAVHRELTRRGLRVTDDREFFSVRLDEALSVIVAVCVSPSQSGAGEDARTGQDALMDALAFHRGAGTQPPDLKKALAAYEEAAALGSRHADYVLYKLYVGGGEVRRSASKASYYGAKVDGHIRQLSKDLDGIIELARMFKGPDFDQIEGRKKYEDAFRLMIENKVYDASFTLIDKIIQDYGYAHSLLEAVAYVFTGIDSKYYQDRLRNEVKQWLDDDGIANYFIDEIHARKDWASINPKIKDSYPFDSIVTRLRQMGTRDLFGYKAEKLLVNLSLLTYADIADRQTVDGRGLVALAQWRYQDKFSDYF